MQRIGTTYYIGVTASDLLLRVQSVACGCFIQFFKLVGVSDLFEMVTYAH
jgi:hypothetical protein